MRAAAQCHTLWRRVCLCTWRTLCLLKCAHDALCPYEAWGMYAAAPDVTEPGGVQACKHAQHVRTKQAATGDGKLAHQQSTTNLGADSRFSALRSSCSSQKKICTIVVRVQVLAKPVGLIKEHRVHSRGSCKAVWHCVAPAPQRVRQKPKRPLYGLWCSVAGLHTVRSEPASPTARRNRANGAHASAAATPHQVP